MENSEKLIKQLKIDRILLATFSVIGLLVITFVARLNVETITILHNKIETLNLYTQQNIDTILKFTKDISQLAIDNDVSQLNLIKGILANVKAIQENQERLIKETKNMITIDLPNREAILEANFQIINLEKSCKGSGTHIKLRGKSYILTCAHLIDNVEKEFLMAQDNKDSYFSMELIRINRIKDLALFTIKGIENYPYLEISDIAPTEGSNVIVIGNPDGLEDVISEGVIAKVGEKGYIITNTIYFGSSGGALIYKGKIVGVISKIITFFLANYGYTVPLKDIQEFLKDVK